MNKKTKAILLILIILPIVLLTAVLLFLKNKIDTTENQIVKDNKLKISQKDYQGLLSSLEPQATTTFIHRRGEYVDVVNSLTPKEIKNNPVTPELLEKIKAN